MLVFIDDEMCIDCEMCVELCPEVFMLEKGHVKVRGAVIPGDKKEIVLKTKDNCPVDAISMEEKKK